MPRIISSDGNPMDFCQDCFLGEDEAEDNYKEMGVNPDTGVNQYEYDPDHVSYEEEGRRCYLCHAELTFEDDFDQ